MVWRQYIIFEPDPEGKWAVGPFQNTLKKSLSQSLFMQNPRLGVWFSSSRTRLFTARCRVSRCWCLIRVLSWISAAFARGGKQKKKNGKMVDNHTNTHHDIAVSFLHKSQIWHPLLSVWVWSLKTIFSNVRNGIILVNLVVESQETQLFNGAEIVKIRTVVLEKTLFYFGFVAGFFNPCSVNFTMLVNRRQESPRTAANQRFFASCSGSTQTWNWVTILSGETQELVITATDSGRWQF